MVEFVFTVDYEIYGNGTGSLKDLVYEPAERLKEIFRKWDARFVNFVEIAELEMIENSGTDPAIDLVNQQIRDFYREGFELGLHLHPQWYKGRYKAGRWELDHSEYNLCNLSRKRITEIIDRSIGYLRKALEVPHFTPLSFRAGNWLFQPTGTAAGVLAERGIKMDSSVFKGGLQRQQGLDYRRARKNGYFWRFSENVDVPDAKGNMLELPIYTQMVPSWKMITSKRIGLQQKGGSPDQPGRKRLARLLDFARFFYPLKLDFCRLKIDELTHMIDEIIWEDRNNPKNYRPIVAIGHTKDLIDLETVDSLLSYLKQKGINVSTFEDIYGKCVKATH